MTSSRVDAQGALVGDLADDGSDDAGPVSVVFGVVGGIHRFLDAALGSADRSEGDCPVHASGVDASDSGAQRSPVPGVARAVRGADVDVITDADGPDGDEGSVGSIGAL